ncbi:DNA adenine methylase [Microbacterium hominis]|uniref:DNA adenine methylase n=1 Tax=Microbacterium hominis TaxID=162426 RepID=UPI00168B6970|nr:DNA adenine methylase [Microbacterium hominis]QOC26059.1 DNA adenine methylase [Microbacterium hominis]QOC30030.1 DNA adenine methylase [Microbacterium hominis]
MVQAEQLTAPFPYFGGKRHVAPMVWDLLGDVEAYVEPFAGSAAVLLGRPEVKGHRREVLNDLDGWITNLWRAIRDRPDEVMSYAGGPVMELDLHARLAWLRERNNGELADWLAGDPEHCDPKAAAWWLSATIGSIGGGTNRGPWKSDGEYLRKTRGAKDGICRAIPHLGQGRAGMRVLAADLPALSARMRNVVITCGDWKRPLSKNLRHYTTVGVLLDPPYEDSKRTSDGQEIYQHDSADVSAEVRAWCAKAPRDWRIVLCGYDDEHDELVDRGWRKLTPPKAVSSGYNVTDLNSQRDRLWVSPACLELNTQQAFDFDALLAHGSEGRES